MQALRSLIVVVFTAASFIFCCTAAADKLLMREIVELSGHRVKTEEDTVALFKATFYEALDDEAYLDRFDELGADLSENLRKRPDIKIYLAAAKLVHAQNALWPFKKIDLVNDGLAQMDMLVQSSPGNFEIRMIAASSAYDLPSLFERKEKSKGELTRLFDNFEEGAKPYPDFLKVEWLGFFIENGFAADVQKYKKLYESWGGDLKDLEGN